MPCSHMFVTLLCVVTAGRTPSLSGSTDCPPSRMFSSFLTTHHHYYTACCPDFYKLLFMQGCNESHTTHTHTPTNTHTHTQQQYSSAKYNSSSFGIPSMDNEIRRIVSLDYYKSPKSVAIMNPETGGGPALSS
ncbi:hypothetical protein FQN60_003443, partial [Etheostoma spectabile]